MPEAIKTKEEVIRMVKEICKKNSAIKLRVDGGAAAWGKLENRELTNEEWKHIGYVTAYADAYGIVPSDLKGN